MLTGSAAAVIAGFSGFVYRYEGVVSSALRSSVELVPVRFPYFFLDFDQLGAAVFLYVLGMLAFFLLLGHIIYFLDRRRVRPPV